MLLLVGLLLTVPPGPASLLRSVAATELAGGPVTDARWNQVAVIEEVRIDPTTGEVSFLVLRFAGEEDLVALPWSAFSVDAKGAVHLVAGDAAVERAQRLHRPRHRRESRGTPAPAAAAPPAMSRGRIIGTLTADADSHRARVRVILDGRTVEVPEALPPGCAPGGSTARR